MTETVLILGNGLSRLAFDEAIRAHDGPVWGCNRVFLDYGDVLTALAGHADVMEEAKAWRDAHGQKYDIFGIDEGLSAPDIYRKDTGTTLIAEALTRGLSVIACGFDLGGADIYSPGHEKKNKTTWVQRWRMIMQRFDPDRVTFWGYDHKPYILSGRPAQEYSRKYLTGEAHIPTPEYQAAVDAWENDYERIWERVPKVYFKNIGAREWSFAEIPGVFRDGMEVIIPEELAKKHAREYPFEFEIRPL